MTVFMTSHYGMMVFGVQVIVGALLLANQYVPLALAVVAALLANILTFHATMMPQGFPIPIVVTILWAVLAWNYRAYFASLFVRNVHPGQRHADVP